jgi:hypothetical protein
VRKAIAEANKNKPARSRKPKNITAEVEKALDLLSDYMHGLHDADVRAVLAERLRAISKEKPDHEPPPTAKLKGTAKPKSKAKPGALVWKGDGIQCTAPAAKGQYYARIVTILGSGSYYEAEHHYGPALLGIHIGNRPSTGVRSVGRAKTMEEVKALAQKDHDKGHDRNAKELLAWEHCGTTRGRHTLQAPAANGIYRISPALLQNLDPTDNSIKGKMRAAHPYRYSVVRVVGDMERVIQTEVDELADAIVLGQADHDAGKDQ